MFDTDLSQANKLNAILSRIVVSKILDLQPDRQIDIDKEKEKLP